MTKRRLRGSNDPKVRATAARFYADTLAELRRVHRLMDEAGLSKAETARILGVHRSTVTRMLSGDRGNITLGTVGALAGAMNHYPVIELRPYEGAGNRGEPTEGIGAEGRTASTGRIVVGGSKADSSRPSSTAARLIVATRG